MRIKVTKAKRLKKYPKPSELGFGKYFSDHMFVADYNRKQSWHNMRIQPVKNFSLSPAAGVLHYGLAIFEGMKAFVGVDKKIRVFRPEFHADRFIRSANRLCMISPSREFLVESICKLIKMDRRCLPKEFGTALYIRPALIGVESYLGLKPAEEFCYFILTSPVSAYYGSTLQPTKIWIESQYVRAAPGGVGECKMGGNYAGSLIASVAANKNGFNQVLWLDAKERRFVEEVGTMNVFFKIKDRILTPKLDGTILNGCTRDSSIQLLRDWGYDVEERKISIDEIVQEYERGSLSEAWGTGTAASVTPIGLFQYKDKTMSIGGGSAGQLTQKLFDGLTSIQYGKSKDKFGWMKII